MNSTMIAMGAALILAAGSASSAALAQQATSAAAPQDRKMTISKGASKAVAELQNAIKANDTPNIPARIAAAEAVAATPDDRYYIAVLKLRTGLAAQDDAVIAASIEAMLASGGALPAEVPLLHRDLGKTYGKLKQYPKAAAAYEQVLKLTPNDAETMIALAEARNHEGKVPEAVAMLQNAIRAKTAAGQKADETWYKRALGLAYNAKLPASIELSRQWAQAYPSESSWRDAIRIYRNMTKPTGEMMLDTLRLARATGALDGDVDYNLYAYTAVDLKNAREAKLLLDEAAAANKIDANKQLFKEIHATLKSRPMPDETILTTNAEKALAGPDVAAVILTGDRFYGVGNFARAADMFRAALAKPGADQNLLNLRLGMALARSGDKAGATAALNAVSGPRAELAKYWLAFLASRA